MKKLITAAAGAVLLVQAAGVAAETKNAFAMAEAYAKSAKANDALLRQYSWDMRVSVTDDGDAKPPELYLVRYTFDGTLQKTLLTPAPQLRGGPFMRLIEKQKMASAKQRADKIADLVKRYTTPTPGMMLDFYTKAKYTPATTGSGMLAIAGTDFVTQGDTAEFWIDEKTKKPHRFAFATTMDGNALTGSVMYEQIPGGPLYAARIDLNIPADNVNALIETFNYQKSN